MRTLLMVRVFCTVSVFVQIMQKNMQITVQNVVLRREGFSSLNSVGKIRYE